MEPNRTGDWSEKTQIKTSRDRWGEREREFTESNDRCKSHRLG